MGLKRRGEHPPYRYPASKPTTVDEALMDKIGQRQPVTAAACEWCGRAVKQNAEGRWYAVKGEERGYDPLTCEASDDCRHSPDQPAPTAYVWLVISTNGRVMSALDNEAAAKHVAGDHWIVERWAVRHLVEVEDGSWLPL